MWATRRGAVWKSPSAGRPERSDWRRRTSRTGWLTGPRSLDPGRRAGPWRRPRCHLRHHGPLSVALAVESAGARLVGAAQPVDGHPAPVDLCARHASPNRATSLAPGWTNPQPLHNTRDSSNAAVQRIQRTAPRWPSVTGKRVMRTLENSAQTRTEERGNTRAHYRTPPPACQTITSDRY
jgi:hypothetical protein